jgi:glycosyltransferase involved in cell wall biosynthesis
MKIICLIDDLVSGGAQRQMTELAIGMKERGHQLILVIYNKELFFLDKLENNGVEVVQILEKNYIKRVFRIRKFIRNQAPDAVLSFLQVPSFIATIAGFPFRNWRLIVGERNADPSILTSPRQMFYRFFHLFADFIVGNSKSNIDLVKKVNPLIPQSKLKVLYNIVDANYISNLDKSDEKNIILNILNIVVVGRYEYQKNYLGLVEAVSLLPMDLRNRLKINCYGAIKSNNLYFKELQNRIKALDLDNYITLNPACKDIFNVYNNADFVALCSHFEGFPNVICEAMALRKPVIVSRVSDVPILLKEDVNGFLCDSENIVSIKDALIKSIESSLEVRKTIGYNNWKLVKDRFSKDRIVDSYLELLTKR